MAGIDPARRGNGESGRAATACFRPGSDDGLHPHGGRSPAFGKKTALGTDLRYTPEYHSVAADWSRFPLGTKFKIRGYDRVFVVDDYGKALVDTSTIDIYFDTKARMNNWGVRRVTIDVLEFGSFHESRKILAERGTFPHCLKMLASMTTDDWWKTYQR